MRRTALLTEPSHYAAITALIVLSAAAFLPAVVTYSATSTRAHHLDHAAIFLFGGLLGLLAGATPVFQVEDLPPRGGALTVALLAPVGMLLAMTPSIYEPLERHTAEHVLYHIGIVALGLVTGIATSRLGRVAGLTLFMFSVTMGVLFAAGAP